MLTVEDICNPKRKSGFDHVSKCGGATPGPKPFMAIDGRGHGHGRGSGWFGPRRATAEEAAQDYCDYVNGQHPQQPSLPKYDAPVVDMGNATEHAPKRPAVTIKRNRFTGPHDLYDVAIYDADTGFVFRRKVGITARGQRRYADIAKTFGFSMKPVAQAVTYPSYEAAEQAERTKIAEVCTDPAWRRVAKECFAPTNLPAAQSGGDDPKEVDTQ